MYEKIQTYTNHEFVAAILYGVWIDSINSYVMKMQDYANQTPVLATLSTVVPSEKIDVI